jgi:S-methylmethionine-dependent homocysteine/selenocysteine methylase
VVGEQMSPEEASEYHDAQIASFVAAGADMVCGLTMTYPGEAVGITQAARARGVPAVISFTTETDGRLPDGTNLRRAIEMVDEATEGGPAYYMLNCAHPDHFRHAMEAGEAWTGRIRGIRANASRMSHAELDQAEELDPGDPVELGQIYGELRATYPGLSVLGGCCGTDHRHVSHMCGACA